MKVTWIGGCLFVRAAISSGWLTFVLIACPLLEGWIASAGERWLWKEIKIEPACPCFNGFSFRNRVRTWGREYAQPVGTCSSGEVVGITWRSCGYLCQQLPRVVFYNCLNLQCHDASRKSGKCFGCWQRNGIPPFWVIMPSCAVRMQLLLFEVVYLLTCKTWW